MELLSQLLRILLLLLLLVLLHHHRGRTDRRGRGGSGEQHAAGQKSQTNKITVKMAAR